MYPSSRFELAQVPNRHSETEVGEQANNELIGVPAIVIRSSSDRADGNATQSYAKFRDTASRTAADLVLATIRELVK